MKRITQSAAETKGLSSNILESLGKGNVICLYGPMGAGKTTLVQGLAKELGVTNTIVSPTFILVRQYLVNPKSKILNHKYRYLWHIDLYRLDHLSQIKNLGIEEIWNDINNLVVIEWPEKVAKLLPESRLDVRLDPVDKDEREIIY